MDILVFQHLDAEHPGTLRTFWAKGGHRLHTVNFEAGDNIPDLAPYDLLVVMGGTMNVWHESEHDWLAPEKAAIRRWVMDMERPYLGICLGHQLLADALGGEVGPMEKPEIGLASVTLTKGGRADAMFDDFPDAWNVFQWHGAEVKRLPDGAHILAGNDACAVQAMRWGRHAYGFQFHPEISETTIEAWESIAEYKADLVKALGREQADELGGVVRPVLPELEATAERINRNLIRHIAG